MSIALVGKKVGMTRLFDKGASIPVTVLSVEPNRIVQIKNLERDGYRAVQVTTGQRRQSRVTKPQAGHFAKANVEAGRGLWEIRLDVTSDEQYEIGGEIKLDVFKEGQMVDVTGTSKGKGFAGSVKRWNFATQDATHGNSLSHRVHGSTGQNQSPGKVFKGKKMAGQMGNKQCTVQNQQIVKVDLERNLLLVRGVVPGAPGADVIVKPAVKEHKGEA